MQYLKKFRFAVSTCLFGVGLAWFCLGQHLPTQAQTADEHTLQFNIAAFVHGFEKAPGLPDGDLFLLPQPLKLTIPRPPANTELFTVTVESFGSPAAMLGALAEVPAHGVSVAQPDTTLRALTCAENIGEGHFILAGTAGAVGDVVRLSLQTSDGLTVRDLLRFTREAEGFRLTDLHAGLKLFVDNRFALGPDTKKETLIPLVDEAGPRGQRTGLLTFSLPVDFDSPLHGCFQLGVEIQRGQNEGTTSVVLTDIVAKRTRVTGDEDNPGHGLLGGLTGGYPTGLPCAVECPQPAPTIAQWR